MESAPHSKGSGSHSRQFAAAKETFTRPKQSRLVRFGKSVRDPVNAWLARQSLIGDDPIVDQAHMPDLAELQSNWQVVQRELKPLLAEREAIPPLGKLSPDHRRIAHSSNWKSFFFEGYGFKAGRNRARCPNTAAMLDRVPGLVVAFFSILEPDTHIPRHRGLTKAWLNCHLGLAIPDDGKRCEIDVAGQKAGWQMGKWLVFDETNQHEVWNDSQQPRVVLFLQVRRPMKWAGRVVARLIYEAIRRTSFVNDVRQAIRS